MNNNPKQQITDPALSNILSLNPQPNNGNKLPKVKKVEKDTAAKFMATLVAILAGLIVGLLIMIISRPYEALPSFYTLIGGWMLLPSQGLTGIGNWLGSLAPVLMTGLAVGFAFKTGLFNIGASGQFTMGMFFALLIAILLKDIPGPWLWMLACLGGILGGALWGLVPGLTKAFFNVNEVITCIMMNYIGMYTVNELIRRIPGLYDGSRNLTARIGENAFNPTIGLRYIFRNSSIDIAFVIAILLAIFIYFVLNKTILGYELKACGLNREAARYGGISEKRAITISFLIAGGLAGLGGAFMILASGADLTYVGPNAGYGFGSGTHYSIAEVILNEGFDGIAIALLGQSNPIGIIFSTLFVTFIKRGGNTIQIYGFKPEIIDIIVAVIVYFSAFALLIGGIITRVKKKRNDKLAFQENVVPPTPSDPSIVDVDKIIIKTGGDQ
jgi:simple sugar transport system permease protein